MQGTSGRVGRAKQQRKEVNTMKIKRTGMFCMNSTLTRQEEIAVGRAAEIEMSENQGEAAVITRVDNFELTGGQIEKLKSIHERAAAEVKEILGW